MNRRIAGLIVSLGFACLALVLPHQAIAQPDYSICGRIKSETLTIPSYKFIVVDKDGKQFENLKVAGELLIAEFKWGHNFADWNWEQTDHFTPIPVTFDPKEGVYVTAEVPKVEFRKGFRRPNCLDRIERFTFTFRLGEKEATQEGGFGGSFNFNLENRKIEETTLPNNSMPIKITLENWNGKQTL